MFSARFITTDADHAGPTDHHNAGPVWESSAKSCSFIPRREDSLAGEVECLCKQGAALVLKWSALLNAARTDHGCSEVSIISIVIGPCVGDAALDGLSEALFSIRSIQMTKAWPFTRGEGVPLSLFPATNAAARAGLSPSKPASSIRLPRVTPEAGLPEWPGKTSQ